MISKEAIALIDMLSKTINRHGHREAKAGFITRAEAVSLLGKSAKVITMRLLTPAGKRYHCYLDDHQYGYLDGENRLFAVPVSSSIPMCVAPRDGLRDGIVLTLDELELVFKNDSVLLDSFSEFIDFVIEYQLYTMNNKIQID